MPNRPPLLTTDWPTLTREQQRTRVVAAVQALAVDGLAPSRTMYDERRPLNCCHSSALMRFLGCSWSKFVEKDCGLKCRVAGYARGTLTRKSESEQQQVIDDMEAELGMPKNWKSVKIELLASERAHPYSYYCTTRRQYVDTVIRYGGHFEANFARSRREAQS